MEFSDIKRVPVSNWDTELIRLTAFLPPGTVTKPDTWWQDVLGSQPDSSTARPKVGELVQIGAAIGGQLTMRVQPARVDWILNPSTEVSDAASLDTSKLVGRFEELLPNFSEVVERWFRLSPALSRIAFGPIVLLPVRDKVEGYRQLIPYLPGVKLDPEGMGDFLYRVNRRRKSESGIESLAINRLCTWSVASVEFRQIAFVPGKTTVVANAAQPSFSCRAEIDINTDPDYNETFNTERALIVWRELRKLGVEVIEKGDVI